MKTMLITFLLAALAASGALADEKPKVDEKPKTDASSKPDDKQMSGISILGNQEAPKSLVIVPWKSSEIGSGIGLANSLNDRAAPVDKDVFGRQLRYYAIRSGGAGH